MKGRRIHGGPGSLEHPGDYTGPVKGYTGDKEAIFFILPSAPHHVLIDPKHFFTLPNATGARGPHHVLIDPKHHSYTLHEDGTITISPSILEKFWEDGEWKDGWHGFLEHGEWREV